VVANFASAARIAKLHPWWLVAVALAAIDGIAAVAALLGVFPA